MPDVEELDARITSTLNRIIHNSQFKKRISLEEQKAQKQDRFTTWSTSTSGWLEPTIPSRNIPNLFTIDFRNDDIQEIWFEMGRNSIINDANPIWWHLEELLQIKKTSLRNSRPCWNCLIWRFIRKNWIWLSHIKDNGEQRYRTESSNSEFLRVVMEILKGTSWSRIRGQNSVDKRFWELVGSGKPTDNVLKETIAISVTTLKSVQKWHTRILLRVLSCWQYERKTSITRSLRGMSPSGRISRRSCKEFLKGTWPNSFCEKWHPPECLFYKFESGCRIWESACIHICWRRMSITIKQDDQSTILTKQIHDNWDAYSRIWSPRILHRFYGRAQTCRNRSNV